MNALSMRCLNAKATTFSSEMGEMKTSGLVMTVDT